jgi:peptidoglycan hydrolase-like protein with peptidoglycan-binding domain
MRKRLLVVAGVVAGVGVLAAGATAAARVAWPAPRVQPSASALAHVTLPRLSGRLEAVRVLTASGTPVPVRVSGGDFWPQHLLGQGQRFLVEVTVRRPGWIGWIAGRTVHRTLTLTTPAVHVRSQMLHVRDGDPVTVGFDTGAQVVAIDGSVKRRNEPAAVLPLGVVAHGATAAGSVEVAAAPRAWQRLSAPVRVSWFPVGVDQAVVTSAPPGTRIPPDEPLTLTFSAPLAAAAPRIRSATAGTWRVLDDHTVTFAPTGLGFPLGGSVRIVLPQKLRAVLPATGRVVRTLQWPVASGSMLRLQQLLAQLGYLPLRWTGTPAAATPAAQLEAALSPPSGTFAWRYEHTPSKLGSFWLPGRSNVLTRAALMRFEDAHGLPADGVPSPAVWRALFADTIAGKRNTGGYTYVLVHESVPQSLSVWHDGKVVATSPGNTGIAQAPTAPGTYPVFEHIAVGTMSGTNPDGTHYNDPGVRWISYFNGGDAIHAFPRSSYGTPQSLGCVELPYTAAEQVWPYTPVGTLVTVEQ